MRKVLYILSLLILSLSCSRHNDAKTFLEKAQSVIETSPDTAAMYLDSILMPEKFLKKDRYMEYLVTNVQAKYKNYDDIKEDTNIFITKAYFDKKTRGSKYQMYSHLYSACVYDERGEYENAMKDYKTAFTLAEEIQDSLYMWRISQYIGDMYLDQLYYDKALEHYKNSITWINNDTHKALRYTDIACVYYMKDMLDSVGYYIRHAVDIVEQTNDERVISQIYQNAHLYYRENNETETAKKYLEMACEISTDSLLGNRYNLNLLALYLKDGDVDSARVYVRKLKDEYKLVEDETMKISICDELVTYYSLVNMCDSALYYQSEISSVSQKIYKRYIEHNIYDIQKKYDYELQRNIYQTKLNKRLILIVCILIVLLLVSIISLIRITKLNRREQVLTKEVEDLSNVKNDYDKFKHEIKESFDNSLKARFDIIRKVNIFERNNKTNKNVKEIKEYAYGSPYKTAFEASVDVIESSYNKITSFIKESYPELNETEYKICLLSIAPISTDDIASIVELGSDSVRKSRSNIRKKLGIEDKKATISGYILEKYYNKNI